MRFLKVVVFTFPAAGSQGGRLLLFQPGTSREYDAWTLFWGALLGDQSWEHQVFRGFDGWWWLMDMFGIDFSYFYLPSGYLT